MIIGIRAGNDRHTRKHVLIHKSKQENMHWCVQNKKKPYT